MCRQARQERKGTLIKEGLLRKETIIWDLGCVGLFRPGLIQGVWKSFVDKRKHKMRVSGSSVLRMGIQHNMHLYMISKHSVGLGPEFKQAQFH